LVLTAQLQQTHHECMIRMSKAATVHPGAVMTKCWDEK